MIMDVASSQLAGYDAVQQGAAYFVLEAGGCLHLSGETLQEFLQRQTTNDIKLLRAGQALPTVLTSATARTLDVLWLIERPAEARIEAVTLPGRAAQTARFLQSRIFFMDRVQVADASASTAQVELAGPQAEEILAGFGADPAAQPFSVQEVVITGVSVTLLRAGWLSQAAGWTLLAPLSQLDAVAEAFEQAGAEKGSSEAYEVLRIEAGQPGPMAELTEDYTPLEVGLLDYISDSKGCYTGQEIIARQITYDKVTKHLASVQLDAPAQPGEELYHDGKRAGKLTSAAYSPRAGAYIGLAVLSRDFASAGTLLKASSGAQASVIEE